LSCIYATTLVIRNIRLRPLKIELNFFISFIDDDR